MQASQSLLSNVTDVECCNYGRVLGKLAVLRAPSQAEGDKETGQTDCAKRMFAKIHEWTSWYKFGVIALNELCHPGDGGNQWLKEKKEEKKGYFGSFAKGAFEGKAQPYCSIDNYAKSRKQHGAQQRLLEFCHFETMEL